MVSGCVSCIPLCTICSKKSSGFCSLYFSGNINGISVQPQGAAAHNFVIHLALSMVCYFLNILPFYARHICRVNLEMTFSCLCPFHFKQVASESVKIYQAISDGTVNLIDKVTVLLTFKIRCFSVQIIYI